MKVKWYSWFPKRDDEGDLFYNFRLLPDINYGYAASKYGNKHTVVMGWLFWEIEIQNL